MARTELMRQLRRMAADHAAAEQLQMPIAEYRGLRDEALAEPNGLSRRQLLSRAAALGLGAAAVAVAGPGQPARADVRGSAASTGAAASGPRVAIVGAGISGLNAALALADKGVPSTIYEANPSRIGGRMYSQGSPANPGYWAQGQVSEYGGELIDTYHHTILDLCQRFRLGTTSVKHAYGPAADQVFWFGGSYYPRTQADIDFKPVWQAIQADVQAGNGYAPTWDNHNAGAVALDNMSVRQWINTRVPGGFASKLGALLDVAYNVEYGTDTQYQSSYALLCLLAWQVTPGHFNIWGGSNERYHITGGNDQLPKAIAAALPSGTIRQGYNLVAVARNTDGTQTLTFTVNGKTQTVTADHTILAVPLPILQQRIDFSKAGLDSMMRGVLSHMTMGACTKLNMQFTSRPWVGTGPWPGESSGEMFSDLSFQQVWDVTAGQSGSNGIMVQYGGGSLARALAPPTAFTNSSVAYTAALVAKVLGQVDPIFPGVKAAYTGKATLAAWHLNPYSLGAYSCWPVGYLTTYAGYEKVAQGRLHFAGEHTSYDSQGYMNGGAAEGARAAAEVLTALGK